MHLPSLVQIGGLSGGSTVVARGYLIDAFVNMSLRFGNLLKPTSGLSLNNCPQSGLLLRIFQFLWIIFLMFGVLGLKLVTITGVFNDFFHNYF